MDAFIFKEKGILEKRSVSAPVLSEIEGGNFGALLAPLFLSPCSSDVHTVYSGSGPRRSGMVLGHEGLARVVETGDEVKDFAPGDIVAVCSVMPEHELLLDGRASDFTGHENFPFSGCKLGRNINGMWQKIFYVPSADMNLAHIPAGLSPEDALMAVDVMATGFSAVLDANIKENDMAVVLGTGPIGLMAVAAAAKRGAEIYAIGAERRRLNSELAMLWGARAVLSYSDGKLLYGRLPDECEKDAPSRSPLANSTGSGAVEAILDITKSRGADSVIITGGMPETLKWASDIARYGTGTVVNVSYIEGSGMISLPVFSLGRGMAGKTFRFSLSRGGRTFTESMLKMALSIRPGRLVTKKLKGFDSIPRALSLMKDRDNDTIKIMVEV